MSATNKLENQILRGLLIDTYSIGDYAAEDIKIVLFSAMGDAETGDGFTEATAVNFPEKSVIGVFDDPVTASGSGTIFNNQDLTFSNSSGVVKTVVGWGLKHEPTGDILITGNFTSNSYNVPNDYDFTISTEKLIINID